MLIVLFGGRVLSTERNGPLKAIKSGQTTKEMAK